jgi:hypothetical protein
MTTKQNPTKLVDVIEKLGEGVTEFRKDAGRKMDAMKDRLEFLEALNDRPNLVCDRPPSPHQHSFGRVLKALSDPRGKVDGFEAEWSQEFVEKTGIDLPGATWIPLSTKAVDYDSESPTSGGSNLVPTELHSNEFVDILRQKSVIMGLNPRVIRGTGNIDVPKQSS